MTSIVTQWRHRDILPTVTIDNGNGELMSLDDEDGIELEADMEEDEYILEALTG